MTKILLNNLSYRYDVFQIVNLFYGMDKIDFVTEDAEININFEERVVSIYSCDNSFQYNLAENTNPKEGIKLAVFTFLKNLTKKELPWGTLVGIRPSKIALNLLKKGMSESEIVDYYNKHFLTRQDKAKLCIDVAALEAKFVNNDKNTVSVYIGMPFCPTRCLYCSFTSNPIASCKSLVEPYLTALSKEISSIGTYIKEKGLKIQCVYFGGGTPTSVNDRDFDYIMNCISDNLINDMDVEEFTVECGRPDSITEGKLNTMKKYGVHRISINPQTMNDITLKRIGRNHTANDVVEQFNLARKLGFNNINMDIIVGLSGEDADYLENTCNQIYSLNPDSVTVHGLSVKRASRLHENLKNNNASVDLDQTEMNKMYEKTVELAAKLNMKPYYMYRQKNMFGNMENIGYSQSSKEGIYNIQMIEERQTIIAAGADAVSKIVFLEENRIERFANVKDVREYINRIDEMINNKLQLLNNLYN